MRWLTQVSRPFPAVGTPELHTHHLIPSLRQVVFQGDRLPFQCTATYLDSSTRIRWYHNRVLVEGDEQTGIILEESLIHDCTFITRYGAGSILPGVLGSEL